MATELVRMVTDRWEWASIAHQAPSVYHEQSWTVATVVRLRAEFSLPIAYAYARVWAGTTLVGCPLVRLGDRWFNSPRAQPLVISGPDVDAPVEMRAALGRMPVDWHDDAGLVKRIVRVESALARNECSRRTYRAMTKRDLAGLAASLSFDNAAHEASWVDAIRSTMISGDWVTEIHHHLDCAGETLGWTIWVHRPARPQGECIAAAAVGQRVPAWTVSR